MNVILHGSHVAYVNLLTQSTKKTKLIILGKSSSLILDTHRFIIPNINVLSVLDNSYSVVDNLDNSH